MESLSKEKEELRKRFMNAFTYKAGDGFRMEPRPTIPLKVFDFFYSEIEARASRIKALEERLDDIDTFLALEEDAAHGDYGRLVTHLRGKILDKLKH